MGTEPTDRSIHGENPPGSATKKERIDIRRFSRRGLFWSAEYGDSAERSDELHRGYIAAVSELASFG